LLIIDDKEFLSERQSLSAKWLSLQQMKQACYILNQVAYRVFESEKTMAQHDQFLMDSLRQALQRLVNRDLRLKLFAEDFWVIDKDLC
jgi:menaquinone-dependent protoporphyrinogen IX oxidase